MAILIRLLVRYADGRSLAQHAVIIALIAVFFVPFAIALYQHLRLQMPMPLAAVLAAASWLIPWSMLLGVFGLTMRYLRRPQGESYLVKGMQYSLTALVVLTYAACYEQLDNQNVILLLLIFEVPALVVIATYAALCGIARVRLSWLTLVSLGCSLFFVTRYALEVG